MAYLARSGIPQAASARNTSATTGFTAQYNSYAGDGLVDAWKAAREPSSISEAYILG